MSLSAKDRQALGSIQDQITGSDPQLASLMTMFTRAGIRRGDAGTRGHPDGRPAAPRPRRSRPHRRRDALCPLAQNTPAPEPAASLVPAVAHRSHHADHGHTGHQLRRRHRIMHAIVGGAGGLRRAGARGQPAPRAAERGQNTRHPSHRAPRSGVRIGAPWARLSARCDIWTHPDTEREQNRAICVRPPAQPIPVVSRAYSALFRPRNNADCSDVVIVPT
jgi:hypothetical protein